jgi:FixJ family two-component response regulator/GGDEF domain-containing protein
MNETFIKKTTVLVVDSDDELSIEVSDILSSRVKAIHYVRDTTDALKVFHEVMPQIVIADLRASTLEIVDFSAKLKSLNYSCELIIVIGHVEPHKLIELVNLGINGFVLKPLSPAKMIDAISKAMDLLLEKAVTFQSKYMQEILNAEENPVFATDGITVLKANKSFLDCFGAKSLSQFSQTYKDLAAVFSFEEGKELSLQWLKEFVLDSEEPKVLIYDNRKGENRVFLLQMGNSGVAKGYFVVTMSDITDIEAVFSRKIEMLSSQISSKERIRFRSMLEFEIARCKRYKKVFSLLLMGFDEHDDLGIEEWEEVFKVIRKELRSSDLFAKVDKNQLAIIATETCRDDASILLQRFRDEFEKMGADKCAAQFRCGAAEFCETDTAATLLKRATSDMK